MRAMRVKNKTMSGDVPGRLILLFAVGCGLAVATLYYNQPMLAVIGAGLGASAPSVAWVPTLTQLGYALGILLLAPLGDRHDRRGVIALKGLALVAALLAAGTAPSITVLALASLAVGVFATLAQDIVPAAATMAADANRGRVVGKVMTGLLLGILLSRVISGVVAAQWGWRVMFLAAGVSIALLVAVAWRQLPSFEATTDLPYGALLRSLGELWLEHPALRRATLAQGLLALAFGAFWSTLAVFLQGAPFHLGSAAAGAYGLAGAAGALAAPLAGRSADSGGPEGVTRIGAAVVTLSFALLFVFPWVSGTAYLWILGASAIGFDFGLQGTLIAHQTIIYGLDPAARSRLNAVLFVGMFVAMALGSMLGSALLAAFGWMGVVGVMAVASLLALAVRLWGGQRVGARTARAV